MECSLDAERGNTQWWSITLVRRSADSFGASQLYFQRTPAHLTFPKPLSALGWGLLAYSLLLGGAIMHLDNFEQTRCSSMCPSLIPPTIDPE